MRFAKVAPFQGWLQSPARGQEPFSSVETGNLPEKRSCRRCLNSLWVFKSFRGLYSHINNIGLLPSSCR